MSDVRAWLNGVLDTEEKIARACLAEVGGTRAGQTYPDGSGPVEVDDYPSYPFGLRESELAFIGRHDPASVLRDIEAKRRILAWVDEQQVPGSTIGDDYLFPLYAIASAYADRDGYDPAWADE